MRALILQGAPPGHPVAETAGESVVTALQDAGWETEALPLFRMRIAYCLGCFGCWIKTPGVCVQDDDGREVARRAARSDALVLLTPVTFGGYSSLLKRAIDRLAPNATPFLAPVGGETHHHPRYQRAPRLVAIGLPPAEPEEVDLLARLVARNALNFHSPGQSAGVLTGAPEREEMTAFVRGLLRKAGVTP